MWFKDLRTALKLAGTVVELNERLTALEGNFDILDRAVKRESARVRAQNSRERKAVEGFEETFQKATTEFNPAESSAIGGIMRRKNGS